MVGRGDTSTGGVHLAGGLANLAYVLAEVEQQFIVPESVQSLIWEDLVPCFMTSAVLPRWWRVTGTNSTPWLFIRISVRSLAGRRQQRKPAPKVADILGDRLDPRRLDQVDKALRAGHSEEALAFVAPAEPSNWRRSSGGSFRMRLVVWGRRGKSSPVSPNVIPRRSVRKSWRRISACRIRPSPRQCPRSSQSEPFPTFLGYSSRLLAESWQSNNLYWGGWLMNGDCHRKCCINWFRI